MAVLADLLRRPATGPLAAAALADDSPGSRPCGTTSTASDLLLRMLSSGGRMGPVLPAAASIYYGLRVEPLRSALIAKADLIHALHAGIVPRFIASSFSIAALAELLRPEPAGQQAAALVRLLTTPDPGVPCEIDPLRFHGLSHIIVQLYDFVGKGNTCDRAGEWPQTHFAARVHHVRRAAVELLPAIVRAAGPEQRRIIVREAKFLPSCCHSCVNRLLREEDARRGRAAASALVEAARLLRDAAAEGGDRAGAAEFDEFILRGSSAP
jgi:hypothetical protein